MLLLWSYLYFTVLYFTIYSAINNAHISTLLITDYSHCHDKVFNLYPAMVGIYIKAYGL